MIYTNICHYYFDQIPCFYFGLWVLCQILSTIAINPGREVKSLLKMQKENQGCKQSNHFCPCILKIYQRSVRGPRNFKFSSTLEGSDEDQSHLKIVRSPSLLFTFVVKAFSLVKRYHFIFHVKSIFGFACLFCMCLFIVFWFDFWVWCLFWFGLFVCFNYTLQALIAL